MSSPTRVTPRGRLVVAGLTLVVAGFVVAGVVRALGAADCTVAIGGREIGLDRDVAEAVSTALAPQVRRDGTSATDIVRAESGLGRGEARLVALALTGEEAAALSCREGGASTSDPDGLEASGLTPRAERVRADLGSRFGDLALGGFAPGGVRDGHMEGSAHYEGRAVDVFFRPVNGANQKSGWALAQYLVAHASRLALDTVIYDDRIWTARRADQGWRDYRVDTSGKPDSVAAILEHRDHVHVDVTD